MQTDSASATATAASAAQTGSTAPIDLGQPLWWLIAVGFLILAYFIVRIPVTLAKAYMDAQLETTDSSGKIIKTSFFQIPYITWFIVHLCVPLIGVLAVVGLALDRAIDAPTIAALLSGLFGFVLGSAASGHSQSASTAQGAGVGKDGGKAGAEGADGGPESK